MRALLIGATGATGSDLLKLLLNDHEFERVDIFVRRPLELRHQKLSTHLIDFDKPQEWEAMVTGDVLFSCLGTTLKAAGSKQAQWKIDYEYQLAFARAARKNNVSRYVLVSSAGASPRSLIFYSKMKGKLEEAVKALGFPQLAIFKPPLLVRKNSNRSMEVASRGILRFINSLGILRSQAPLETEVLAHSMLSIAKNDRPGLTISDGRKITESFQGEYAN